MAIADGATAVISFNYGAKAYSRVRGAIRFMTQLAFGYTALSWLLISLFPAAFIRISIRCRHAARGDPRRFTSISSALS